MADPVIWIAGQSNCEGGSDTVLPLDMTVVQQTNWWTRYEQPVGVQIYQSVNWELVAASALGVGVERSIANRIGDRTRIFKFAAGGSGLANDWLPAVATLYPQWFVHWASAVASAGVAVAPKVVVWIQGETDALNLVNANAYGANLTTLIAQVRTDLGLPLLPFIIPQLSILNTAAFVAQVRAGQQAVAAADPLVTLLDIDAYPLKADNTHWSFESVADIGFLIANSILSQNLLAA